MPTKKRAAYNPNLPTAKCPQCRGTGARPGAMRAIAESRDQSPAVNLRCSYCGGCGLVNVAESPNR